MSVVEERISDVSFSPPGSHLTPTEKQSVSGHQRIQVRRIEAAPLKFPYSILFGAMPDRNLRMKRPLEVTVSRCGESFVAHSQEVEEFGYGENISEALEDLGKTLAELYHSLAAEFDRLGGDLKQHFQRVSEFVELRNEGSRVQPPRI